MEDPGSKAPPPPNDPCTMATSKDGHKETEESKVDKDIRDEEGGREKLESLNCLKFALLMFLPELACLHGVKPLSQQYYIALPRVSQHAAHVPWRSCLLCMPHGVPTYGVC